MNVNDITTFMQNPLAMLMRKYNIPQGMNNPQDILQHLLNSGQVSQEQINQAMQMRNNPFFRQFMK